MSAKQAYWWHVVRASLGHFEPLTPAQFRQLVKALTT